MNFLSTYEVRREAGALYYDSNSVELLSGEGGGGHHQIGNGGGDV